MLECAWHIATAKASATSSGFGIFSKFNIILTICCICGFLNGANAYVIDEDGVLFCYDIQDESILWKIETEGKQRVPITTTKSLIAVAGGPNNDILKIIVLN